MLDVLVKYSCLLLMLLFSVTLAAQKKWSNFACNYDPAYAFVRNPVTVNNGEAFFTVTINFDQEFFSLLELHNVKDSVVEMHCKFICWDVLDEKKLQTEVFVLEINKNVNFSKQIEFDTPFDFKTALFVELAGVNSAYYYKHMFSHSEVLCNSMRAVADTCSPNSEDYCCYQADDEDVSLDDPEVLVEAVNIVLEDGLIDSLFHKTGDLKLAVDLYWYSASKSETVEAKEAIRIFYNRYQIGKKLFFDDERMKLFVLFGMPSYVSKKPGEELWQYDFDKKEDFLLKLDVEDNRAVYLLEQTQERKEIIERAKRSWRNARPVIE